MQASPKYKPPIDPKIARQHYSRTLRDDRVLFTGHSHRAWPDCIMEGQKRAVELAWTHVDHKWTEPGHGIFSKVFPEFQGLVAERVGVSNSSLIVFGENTHELVSRVLSCFEWSRKLLSFHWPLGTLLTTTSEFHSASRELNRMREDGAKIVAVSTDYKPDLSERLLHAINRNTKVLLVSTVFFNDGSVLQKLEEIIEKARSVGAVVILDAYHSFNIRPLNIDSLGKDIFVVAGGYKYGQWGEGAAWMKVPEVCAFRPRRSGWFADFSALEKPTYPYPVQYGEGAYRFLGATKDVSGMCRAIAVLRFMKEMGWTPELLARNNTYQTAHLTEMVYLYDLLRLGVNIISSRKDFERGPFLALGLKSPEFAEHVCRELWNKHRVLVDSRGSILRIGPAEYTTGEEMTILMDALSKVLRS